MAHEIKITKRLSATPDEVYDAWTNPGSVAQWMSAGPGMTSKATKMDARVGGKFHIDMEGNGKTYPHDGEYLRLDRPRVIEFTWISPGTEMKRTVVTIELRPVGREETELTLTHTGFTSKESSEDHKQGWTAIVDSLAEVLAKARK